MSLCTVEAAAESLGMEPWVLRDLAVLGGSPQAYGPMRVEGSEFRVMLNADDVRAWDAAGRPIASSAYRDPPPAPKPRRRWWPFAA